MKEGPDISRIAALIGDPARANILTALLSGQALTAKELATEAGITPQTASSHLARLAEGGLIVVMAQGRHRYTRLASAEVVQVLEALLGLAQTGAGLRNRPGPRDDALRAARLCYNHLAGSAGVQMFDSLAATGSLFSGTGGLALTSAGRARLTALGLDLAALDAGRPPLCRECLDWSERRPHLGGRLGSLLFTHAEREGWLKRVPGSRAVTFTPTGRRAFDAAFPAPK